MTGPSLGVWNFRYWNLFNWDKTLKPNNNRESRSRKLRHLKFLGPYGGEDYWRSGLQNLMSGCALRESGELLPEINILNRAVWRSPRRWYQMNLRWSVYGPVSIYFTTRLKPAWKTATLTFNDAFMKFNGFMLRFQRWYQIIWSLTALWVVGKSQKKSSLEKVASWINHMVPTNR